MKVNFINGKTREVKQIVIKAYVPEFTQRENTSKGWVNFGKNNQYPKELVDLVDGSGIGAACVDTKANFIRGGGFVWDEKDRFQEALYNKLTNDALLDKTAIDQTYFEGFAWNIRYNKLGKITEIKHIDFSWCRLGIADELTKEITKIYVSPDWKQASKKGYEPIEMPIFNPDPAQIRAEMAQYGKEYKGQILYSRKYKPGNFYYRQPTWAASDNRLDIDRQIGEFHVENLENGMFPGTVMYLPGDDWDSVINDDTKETKKEAFKKYQKEHFTGKGNRGNVLHTFGPTKDEAPQILPFAQNANGDMFMALDGQTLKYIPSAFQVPPLLAGIEMQGSSLAADQISNQVELFQNGVIAPHQLTITDTLYRLIPYMEGFKGEPAYPQIQVLKPINFIPPEFISDLSKEERRIYIGFPAKAEDSDLNINRTMNGAQVSSMVQVVEAAAAGAIPRESALKIMEFAFGLTPEEAEDLLATVGNGFKAKITQP